jgi:hypothetical protein
MAGFKGQLAVQAVVCYVALLSAAVVSAANPAWYPGPKFQVNADSEAVNTFVGQVAPSGQNQLKGTIRMDENGYFINAQNQQVKDLTIVYGPEDPADPIEIGKFGPGATKYVQDPSMEGGFANGLNIQLNAKPGYHFVAVSFGVAISTYGTYNDAFFVDGLGSSTVGSGKITVTSIASYFAEGKFVASNIYTPQITIVPNNAVPAGRFALDNVEYVLERN